MIIKLRHLLAPTVVVMLLLTCQPAQAQLYEITSQLPNLISPALSGSMRYKGFVELSGTAGIGSNRANMLGISTSQGFQYSSWFFMGVGLGVDVAMSRQSATDSTVNSDNWPSYYDHNSSSTKAMIPVFTDFRFIIGNQNKVGAYVDFKFGASWLIGDSYLRLQHGRLGGATQFYFKPSAGVRIPINSKNPRQAVNIGVTYQLTTANNNFYYWDASDATLSGLGMTVGFEW